MREYRDTIGIIANLHTQQTETGTAFWSKPNEEMSSRTGSKFGQQEIARNLHSWEDPPNSGIDVAGCCNGKLPVCRYSWHMVWAQCYKRWKCFWQSNCYAHEQIRDSQMVWGSPKNVAWNHWNEFQIVGAAIWSLSMMTVRWWLQGFSPFRRLLSERLLAAVVEKGKEKRKKFYIMKSGDPFYIVFFFRLNNWLNW